ncbi:MAG: peptide-N-glycosidase F-related protein [Owenweeksia sp.]|nr:peptide-N-glycosidase F-related protein [Owenweeksia sp.]
MGGQQILSQAIWRDDCGLNPIWPQAGTWLFDRANWCPGDKSLYRTHDLSGYLSGNSMDVDVDLEAYSYTVPAGESPASYNYSVQLIQYAPPNHLNDVELERILTPSDADELARTESRVRHRPVKNSQ